MSGYAVNFGSSPAEKTVDVTGVVNNGPLSLTLYNHNQIYTKGFNLTGNPYPSPVDWDEAGWTKTNIDDAIYYFRASTTDQYVGTYQSYINGTSSDNIVSNIIPSMQGFFVHVTDGTWPVTGTLGVDNSVRITDLSHSYTKSSGSSALPYLRMSAKFSDDAGSIDPLVIYFDQKATPGFDSRLDALKLYNTDLKVPNLYAIAPDGSKLSISALPEMASDSATIPLGLKLNRTGSIVFKIQDIDNSLKGKRIYLTDLVAGTEQDLLPDKEYMVSLSAGEYINRFYLNMKEISTDIPDDPLNPDLFSIYSTKGILIALIGRLEGESGTITVYNLAGQTLFVEKIFEAGYHEFYTRLKNGIYIVNYTSGKFRSTKKLFIQNR